MKSLLPSVLSRSFVALAVCALFGGAAFAQAPAKPAPPGATPAAPPAEKPKPLASADSTYVKNALKSLTYLIQLVDAGKPLADAAKEPGDPGKRLHDEAAKDLGSVRTALTKIADAHGEKPAEMSGTDKTDLDRVTKAFAKPDKIDPKKPAKEWVAALAKELKRLDHDTETASKSSQDPDLKTFFTNYSPTIRSTYTSAEAMEKSLKAAKR